MAQVSPLCSFQHEEQSHGYVEGWTIKTEMIVAPARLD